LEGKQDGLNKKKITVKQAARVQKDMLDKYTKKETELLT
jgi:hypothetical protein